MAALFSFDIYDDPTISIEQIHDDEWIIVLEDDAGMTVRIRGTADTLERALSEIQNKLSAERMIAAAGLLG
jgi:hypothetical protein